MDIRELITAYEYAGAWKLCCDQYWDYYKKVIKGVLPNEFAEDLEANHFYHDWTLHSIKYSNGTGSMEYPKISLCLQHADELVTIAFVDVAVFEVNADLGKFYTAYCEDLLFCAFARAGKHLIFHTIFASGTKLYIEFSSLTFAKRTSDLKLETTGDNVM